MLKTLMIVAYLISHPTGKVTVPGAFVLSSPAFKSTEVIPLLFTCHGPDISMPLQWKRAPQDTKSLALLFIDEDVPRNGWYHWAVYNIAPTTTQLPKNFHPTDPVQLATNSWGKAAYQGPCPPKGERHYIIKLYALDKKLLRPGLSTIQLRETMRHHIIGSAQIRGRSLAPTIQ